MARPTLQEALNKKRELSEKQLSFVIWSALPEGVREPKTEEDFCLAVGVSRQSLWRWKKDPLVQDAIRFVVIQNAGKPEYVTQVLDMVKEAALDTNARTSEKMKAAEIWLRATGVMAVTAGKTNPIFEHFDNDSGFADFSDEMLAIMKDQAEASAAEMRAVSAAREALAVAP